MNSSPFHRAHGVQTCGYQGHEAQKVSLLESVKAKAGGGGGGVQVNSQDAGTSGWA